MPRRLPTTITIEEFKQLFEESKKKRDSHRKGKSFTTRGKRINQYMIAMLCGFYSGMRISEIVGLEGRVPPLSKECVENNLVRVKSGKGEKDRVVPRPKQLNQNAVNELPLKIKRRALQGYVTDLGMKVLNKKITFHTLRHGFGSHLAGSGRPLHEVQMLMGHSRLDTTGIYLHANPQTALKGAEEVF